MSLRTSVEHTSSEGEPVEQVMIGVRVTFVLSESSSRRVSTFIAAWHGRRWIEAQSGRAMAITRKVEERLRGHVDSSL